MTKRKIGVWWLIVYIWVGVTIVLLNECGC